MMDIKVLNGKVELDINQFNILVDFYKNGKNDIDKLSQEITRLKKFFIIDKDLCLDLQKVFSYIQTIRHSNAQIDITYNDIESIIQKLDLKKIVSAPIESQGKTFILPVYKDQLEYERK